MDLQDSISNLIDVRSKLSLLSSIDAELFNLPSDSYSPKVRELLHGVKILSSSISHDIENIIENLEN